MFAMEQGNLKWRCDAGRMVATDNYSSVDFDLGADDAL
jgi:hypothetical protein